MKTHKSCIKSINEKTGGGSLNLRPFCVYGYWMESFNALPGIATGPGVALFHLERAEAHQLYLVPGFHRLGQRVGQSTQRGLAVLLDRPDFSAMADTNSTLSMQKHPLYENYRVIVHLFGLYRKMILHA